MMLLASVVSASTRSLHSSCLCCGLPPNIPLAATRGDAKPPQTDERYIVEFHALQIVDPLTVTGIMPPRPLERSYKNALSILQSRRRPGRPNVEATSNVPGMTRVPDAKGRSELKGIPSIVGMKQWLQQIGHSTADIDNLNIVHVAGTKGKGSTCAFIESFLRAFGRRTGFPRKTGLYTSPHLIYPEERIRINFQPISRDLFTKYFFEVWDALSKGDGSSQASPRYLQLMALVSFHAFISEGVEAAVYETHHGGEYDATNVIEHPIVTVVTTLGMDHVKQLGPTIESIAWHKAGIFKSGSRAVSSPQEASAAEFLRSRASEKDISVQFVDNDPSLPADMLQLKPDVQRTNCSVALAAVRCFLEEKAAKGMASLSSSDIIQGISQFSWPGRFQVLQEETCTWFLDGAHNEMSVTKAAEWFIESSQGHGTDAVRILIFSQVSEQRDSTVVLEQLANDLSSVHIHHVIFTNYDPQQDFESATAMTVKPDDTSYATFGKIWKKYHKGSHILFEPNVDEALNTARKLGAEVGGMHTLVTGNTHIAHLSETKELGSQNKVKGSCWDGARLEQEGLWRLPLKDPLAVPTYLVNTLLTLEPSTPDSPGVSTHSANISYDIGSFTLQVSECRIIMADIIKDGYDANKKAFHCFEDPRKRDPGAYITLRYLGKTEGKPWNRHLSNIRSRFLSGFLSQFFKRAANRAAQIVKSRGGEGVRIFSRARAAVRHLTSSIPIDATVRSARDERCVAAKGAIIVEVITSDFDFIRSSGNPGSSPGTTFFALGAFIKLERKDQLPRKFKGMASSSSLRNGIHAQQ
ncbi:hypothetical protein OPT61_g620 [Boeremia exigua]|uniref:Uncharacterized protein n=1 Tax=Boeremia exigua TaxID=749465 RepID=A0ACC2IT82_9PLEO|nr:hypothetical protein OPT61_g620 [Boeremia exigua]